jgi:hypothetical protein
MAGIDRVANFFSAKFTPAVNIATRNWVEISQDCCPMLGDSTSTGTVDEIDVITEGAIPLTSPAIPQTASKPAPKRRNRWTNKER